MMNEQSLPKGNILPRKEVEAQRAYVAQIHAENDRLAVEHGSRRRAFVLTFGCQQNEVDSEKLMGMSEAMGCVLTDRLEDADLILVNTCAIREHADLDSEDSLLPNIREHCVWSIADDLGGGKHKIWSHKTDTIKERN